MSVVHRSRRAACAACLRPLRSCLCGFAVPVKSIARLLILQHPDEVSHAKGSARLLHLCLPGSVLLVGERYDAQQLREALQHDGAQPLLLYPATPGGLIATPPPMDPALLARPARLRLVVLDATWRKSVKMLVHNPILQTLPRCSLAAPAPSRYLIRKAPRPGQLSTLEAACAALAQIEGDPARYAPVLHAFDALVAQRLAFAHDAPQ